MMNRFSSGYDEKKSLATKVEDNENTAPIFVALHRD